MFSKIKYNVPIALSHVAIASRMTINDSLVVGSITPSDCNDTINTNSMNIRLSQMAIPGVSPNSSFNNTNGRSGIVFPAISRNNFMPIRLWTGVGIYPCCKFVFEESIIKELVLEYFQ